MGKETDIAQRAFNLVREILIFAYLRSTLSENSVHKLNTVLLYAHIHPTVSRVIRQTKHAFVRSR